LVVNANGLRNKLATLETACNYIKPDILVISETKIDSNILNQEILPAQFTGNCFRRDRTLHGGGVLLAVREGINCSHVDTPAVKDSEQVWAKVLIANKPDLFIGSFYRPPSAGDAPLHELDSVLASLPPDKNIFIGGDFNCREIEWSNYTSPNILHCRKLIDICNDHSLSQVNLKPTRQSSILELFMTNNPSLIRNCSVVPGLSDHDGMVVTDTNILPSVTKTVNRKIPLYKSANWDSIHEKANLFKSDYLQSCDSDTVEANWNKIKSFINNLMSDDIPHKTINGRNRLPWFDRSAKSLVRKKQKLYNRARNTQRQEDWDAYHRVRYALQKYLKDKKNAHVNNILVTAMEKKNTKPFWNYVKALRRDNVGTAPLLDEGTLRSDPTERAEILGRQFESVFVDDTDLGGIPTPPGPPTPSISNLIITESGILKLLQQLDTTKASGPDNIPNKLLKELAIYLAPVLTSLYNQSLQTGNLPSDWLTASVTPVFKKGNRSLASNYRPISLVSVACKILEHCIVSHVMEHFDKYNILSPFQHGFRKNRSCESQLALTIHDILTKHSRSGRVDIAVLDFSKAFDTVPHTRLLTKLKHYGVTGNTLSWIKTFITGRTQRVVVEGRGSRLADVRSGVPQGTCLGPVLFLAFINDLPCHVQTQIRLFADDCLLYQPVSSVEDSLVLQRDLKALEAWSDAWGLRFNAQKCHVISTGKESHPFFYQLNGTILKQVRSHPYLGVELADSLSFSAHIANITKTASQKLGFLRRNLRHCPHALRSLSYFALVRSGLEYCSSVWDPHLARDIQQLERVQRNAARFVCGEFRRGPEISVTALLERLKWPTLAERRRSARLVLFYKAHTGVVAIPLDNILTKADGRTRGAHSNYKQFATKSNLVLNSFIPKTVKQWNSLDLDIKTSSTVAEFKNRLCGDTI